MGRRLIGGSGIARRSEDSRENAQARPLSTLLPQGGPKRGAEPLKIVMAIIKPFKLDEVRDALTGIGVHGMTVNELKGYWPHEGDPVHSRGREYAGGFRRQLHI